jgi:hypothetical protein
MLCVASGERLAPVGVPLVRGCLKALLGLAVASAVAAGCGEKERRVPGISEGKHREQVAGNPYALTCGDVARQAQSSTNQRLVIRAEFALAQEPVLRKRVAKMTLNRAGRSVYWALTEICKGRASSFEPAREAVQAVRQGKYLVQPRPESWSHPELWSRPSPEAAAGD